MGLFDRLRRNRAARPERADQLYLDDPRFDGWEVVRTYEELETARAFRQQLDEAGLAAVITADHPLDRFGRGEIYLQVPPESWSEAEALLSNLDVD
jgi:hypothetical protein